MVALRVPGYGRVALLAIAALSSAGCSTLQPQEGAANPFAWMQGEKPAAEEPKQPTGPTYTVEIRRDGYTPQITQIPYTETIHIQDALVKSGATKKLKRMELYVLRTPPNGGPRQRLTAMWDAGEGRVAWESDYAIYPGDYIVAIEDKTSQFDDMVNRFLGPLGQSK